MGEGEGRYKYLLRSTVRPGKDSLTWVTFSHTLGGEENPLILVAGL